MMVIDFKSAPKISKTFSYFNLYLAQIHSLLQLILSVANNVRQTLITFNNSMMSHSLGG